MILGLYRIKNESRWIERSITSILPLCDQIIVMDDHSEDSTVAICRSLPKVRVHPSPFEGLNEVRDKNWLLDKAAELNPEWCIFIDGDEVLAPGAEAKVRSAMKGRACISLPILYLWNDEQHMRVDGVYGDFRRESIFRPNGSKYQSGGMVGFHCGNVPWGARQTRQYINAPLYHFGYMHREDRLRKWEFYNSHDPTNASEGYDPQFPERRSYCHVIQGDLDIVPASAKLIHAGPLQLRQL